MVMKIKLKQLRESHPNKPSQREMGDYLGIAEGNYRKLENGFTKSISLELFSKLCEYFKCTPNDILEYVEDT